MLLGWENRLVWNANALRVKQSVLCGIIVAQFQKDAPRVHKVVFVAWEPWSALTRWQGCDGWLCSSIIQLYCIWEFSLTERARMAGLSDTACCHNDYDGQAYCLTREMVVNSAQMSTYYYLQCCELLVNTGNTTRAYDDCGLYVCMDGLKCRRRDAWGHWWQRKKGDHNYLFSQGMPWFEGMNRIQYIKPWMSSKAKLQSLFIQAMASDKQMSAKLLVDCRKCYG